MSNLRAYIMCRFAKKSGVYTSWMDRCSIPCTVVDEYAPDWPIPDDAGIVITHMHYRWEEISAMRRIQERGSVPVLVLADGILEYRNTWEHPELADGAIFQPLMGHKLATIGRGQQRIIESWGNVGQCELVGLPRLDSIDLENVPPVRTDGPFRLLIATANTPAFNDEQREVVIRSLTHIKERLESNSKVNGRNVIVTWRLTDGLEAEIGLPEPAADEERPPLSEVIENVDAVITTPSTLYLESILRRRPTAILDFYNSPSYVTGAWAVNAPVHFNSVLRELAAPPHHKMLFQDSVLNDQLERATPATPRLLRLIDAMIAEGVKARSENRKIALPARILPDPQHGFVRVSKEFDLAKLYSKNEVFLEKDVAKLQVELAQAIQRLDTLPQELAEKTKFLTATIEMLAAARERSASMHARVTDLRRRVNHLRKRAGLHLEKRKKD